MALTQAGSSTRRGSILAAALQAFSAAGYEATSIEDICRAAPASVGSFYHHFGSKEGVAAALYAAAVEQFQASLQIALAEPREPRAMASILVRSHLTWVRDHELWARYLLQMGTAPATAAAQPSVRARNQSLIASLEAWAAPYIEQGVLVPLAPEALLALVLGPSHFVAKAWLSGGPEITESLILQFAESAWRSIQFGGDISASHLR